MPTNEFTTPHFVSRIRAGDSDALERVIKAYLPQIYRAAKGTGLADDDAEDVAQETFKTFLEISSRFEGRSHVRTWIFGIFFRKLAERRRAQGREVVLDDVERVFESRFDARGGWIEPPVEPDEAMTAKDARRQISECLAASPERHRDAFVLREVEGLSMREICKILGVTSTNLGVMLHRIRNRLRDCLEALGVKGVL